MAFEQEPYDLEDNSPVDAIRNPSIKQFVDEWISESNEELVVRKIQEALRLPLDGEWNRGIGETLNIEDQEPLLNRLKELRASYLISVAAADPSKEAELDDKLAKNNAYTFYE